MHTLDHDPDSRRVAAKFLSEPNVSVRDADNQIIYRRALEHFGYGVLEAVDGEEATRLTSEHLPDLVLMDISIPRMDGWEATKRLPSDRAFFAASISQRQARATSHQPQFDCPSPE